jgi:hypothetical protein
MTFAAARMISDKVMREERLGGREVRGPPGIKIDSSGILLG